MHVLYNIRFCEFGVLAFVSVKQRDQEPAGLTQEPEQERSSNTISQMTVETLYGTHCVSL